MPSLSKVDPTASGADCIDPGGMISSFSDSPGIPHSSPSPMPDHVFFEKTVLQRKFGDRTPSSRASPIVRRPLTSPEVAWRPVIAGLSRFLPASKNSFVPAVIQTLGDALAAAQGGDALLAAQARHHDPDLLLSRILLACLAANIPNRSLRRVSSCSLISVVHLRFPSKVTTKRARNSSVMQLPQFVRKGADVRQRSTSPLRLSPNGAIPSYPNHSYVCTDYYASQ